MIITKMAKILIKLIFIYLISTSYNSAFSSNDSFDVWLKKLKLDALANGISQNTIDHTLSDVRFLPKLIEYDRYQPEFYEDTFT